MYVSLSRLFEYEREGCPCRVNGGFTGGSAALIVPEFLEDTCNNHGCGRGGPIPWPSNSPDLTPPDIFVWEHVKSLVYGQRPQNEADLQQKITAAFAQITPEILLSTLRNMSARYELWCVRRGCHIGC
jgi:hypothetical protein